MRLVLVSLELQLIYVVTDVYAWSLCQISI